GRIYKATTGGSGTWTVERTVTSSVGQGMEVHNDYLYYTRNTTLGRYGLLSGSPTFDDSFQTGLNDTSASGFAPIKAFKEGIAVGQGNDLGWYDGTTWTQNKVVLPIGFNIRTLEVIDEFLAIGAWRGNSVTDSEQGLIFFWDGSATTFNFFVEVPYGSVNAMVNTQNRLFSSIGSSGELYLGFQPFRKVHKIPKLEFARYLDIFPGAITNWKGLVHIGVSGNLDSSSVKGGVYQWGSVSSKYAEALNYPYTISTGTTTGTTLRIGALEGIGDELYIGWRDNTTYGVDRVIQTASPYANGTIEGLIFDDQRAEMDKTALVLKATHKALVSGESVQLGYKIDRAAAYTTGTANATVGSITTRLPIPNADRRFNELQYEAILATTGATSPTLTSLSLLYEDNVGSEGEY
ncbi:MAG: hypothetical protein QME66_04365, partial [Candidatus Eisenbacteria bacterium]|nr:hypothetical protein [Candidatus Eisenbacteria bacterium]